VERAVAGGVQQTRPRRDRDPRAGDGKAVRGARTQTQAAPPLLALSPHDTHQTLVQVRVDDTTHEIPVLQELLPHWPLRGRVVSAAARHTPTALAQRLLDPHAAYLLTVKDNQPRVRAELAAYCTAQQATARVAPTVDRPRGRTETRTVQASTRLNAYRRASFAFPGSAQIAHLTRSVRPGATTRSETVYLITSLTPRQAEPARVRALIRGPWSLESRQWLPEVTCGEDAARVRTGAAPQIMAAVRNVVLPLIRRTGTTQIAAYRQHLRTHPTKARRLLVPKKRSA
jgi:predicted transposase YbfD/YdcC